MNKIKAQLVMILRKKIGAPLMKCKKALIKFNGDLIKAEIFLKSKLNIKCYSIQQKLNNGIIYIYINKNKNMATLVEINCETDFVAKTPEVIFFAKNVCKIITNNNSIKSNKNTLIKINNKLIEEMRLNLINKVNENIFIRRYKKIYTNNKLTYYLHDKKIGVLVEYEGKNKKIAKNIAMHIAAMNPIAISSNEIPYNIIEKEKSILLLKVSNINKTEEIKKKIINNSINKFLKENSLYNQLFIKDNKKTIKQIIDENKIKINSFYNFILGQKIKIN